MSKTAFMLARTFQTKGTRHFCSGGILEDNLLLLWGSLPGKDSLI